MDDMHPIKLNKFINKSIENHNLFKHKDKNQCQHNEDEMILMKAEWNNRHITITNRESNEESSYSTQTGLNYQYIKNDDGKDKDNPYSTPQHMEGSDWELQEDGYWRSTERDKHQDHQKDYGNINRMKESKENEQLWDGGANRIVCNDMNILQDVQELKTPIIMSSCNEDGDIKCTAVGKLPLQATNGETITPTAYYCAQIDGIILSPAAIIQQHQDRFIGWFQYANCDQSRGEIRLMARDGQEDLCFSTKSSNGLWYHNHNNKQNKGMNHKAIGNDNGLINKLSNAARYELWHQRSAHAGQKVLEQWHKHAEGIPKLKGNHFYKCPACMATKLARRKQPIGKPTANTSVSTNTQTSDDTRKDQQEQQRDMKVGQHFSMDFGFVRGKEFQTKDKEGRTITSIDGYNSYLLIIDRKSRYTWVYLTSSKTPPIETVQRLLNKFKNESCKHRTVRVDKGGELGKSSKFIEMIAKENFTLEITGTDASAQNGLAERPNQTYGQAMRCLLESAELGPEYWSFALLHAVYIRNRIPHTSIYKTPYEAITGIKPDVRHFRIFGSRIYVRNPQQVAKLDLNTSVGRFLGFTATPKNVIYIDEASKRIKTGTHVIFDEAHFSERADKVPLAAQTLQRLGYHAKEEYIDEIIEEAENSKLYIQKLHKDAKIPERGSKEAIGYDLYSCNTENIVIKPNTLGIIPTGIALKCPQHTYGRIAPRSGLTIKKQLTTMAGVIDRDYTGEIMIILHNFGQTDRTIVKGMKIAQYIIERADTIPIEVVRRLPTTERGNNGFGSSDKNNNNMNVSEPTTHVTTETINNDSLDMSRAQLKNLQTSLNASFTPSINLQLSQDPIDNYTTRLLQIKSNDDNLLGMILKQCENRNLPKLIECKQGQSAIKMKHWRSQLRHGYITHVNNKPIYTINDIKNEIQQLRNNHQKEVIINFATINKQAMHPQLGIPQLYHDQMNIIAEHLWSMKYNPEFNGEEEGISTDPMKLYEERNNFNKKDKATVRLIRECLKLEKRKNDATIMKVLARKRRKLTRRYLQAQEDWIDWRNSEFKQLNQYHSQGTFSKPLPLPEGANLLPLLWTYLVKDDGTKKARCVCNGSPRLRGSVTLAETYAGSLEQTGARIFWAATAIHNFITIGADASNAFAEAPAPKAPLYVTIDQPFKEWYAQKFPDEPEIPEDYVLKVNGALQGHPESARLWAKLIDKVIRELNLKPCAHEPCLYYTTNYNNTGKTVLFLRQVDDFAVACQDKELAQEVIENINSKMTINVKMLGQIERFNGIDVEQTRHYVKLYNKTYINKIMQKHQWIKREDKSKTQKEFPIPMHPDTSYQRNLEQPSSPTSEEIKQLEKLNEFGYRQGIGELIYALTTCRPDISYSTIKLSQYSTRPTQLHFDAVKQVYRYLSATKEDGIYFWRKTPRMDLPEGPLPITKPDKNYNEEEILTRQQHHHNRMRGAVDSDFAGDTEHRKSVSGICLKIAGGSVLYKTRYQEHIAHSSTEAEFVAAAEAGRYIMYVRSILDEIGIPQNEAVTLYEDNRGALLMANAQQPTKRTRHMEIKHFALQDWVEEDLLKLEAIGTSDNYSDSLTKAQGRTLFHRHMNHIMGKLIPEYSPIFKSGINTNSITETTDQISTGGCDTEYGEDENMRNKEEK